MKIYPYLLINLTFIHFKPCLIPKYSSCYSETQPIFSNCLVPGIDAPEPVFFCSVEPPDTKSTHDFERALQNLCKEVGYTYLVLKSLLAYSCRFHLEALIQRGSKINFTEVSF